MEKTYILENRKNIPVINNHIDAPQWIIRAKGKDETRISLNTIHIEDGIYFATDGHRLHIYSPDTEEMPVDMIIPDGNYEVVTNNKNQIILRKTDVEYPDIWNILNYRPKNGITSLSLSFGYKKDKDRDIMELSTLAKHIYTNTNQAFRIDFLKDAMFEGKLKFETNANSPKFGPIVFGNDERIAVIMPFREGTRY